MISNTQVLVNSLHSEAYEFIGIYKIENGEETILSSSNNSRISIPVGTSSSILIKLKEKTTTHYIVVNIEGLYAYSEYITECTLTIKNSKSGTSNINITNLTNISKEKSVEVPITQDNVTWSVWLTINRGQSNASVNNWFKGLYIGSQLYVTDSMPSSSSNAFSCTTKVTDKCYIEGYKEAECTITFKF